MTRIIRMRNWLSLSMVVGLVLVAGLSGCSSIAVVNALTPPMGYSVSNNVAFDDRHDLKLDVYTPDGAVDAPVVVFFYSRRWQRGDKQDVAFVGQSLAAQGFVVMIPNARHYPQARYKQFLDDRARAVVWAHKFARAYGGSADKLVVMGFDSGAYDAAMLTLDPHWLDEDGGRVDWIKGMVGISGPYDLMPITASDLRDIFGPADQFAKTQPVNWTGGGNPPLLMIASKADGIVPVSQTDALFKAVKDANGTVEKIIYRDLSHDETLNVLSAPLRGRADELSNITAFVRRVTHTAAPKPPPKL